MPTASVSADDSRRRRRCSGAGARGAPKPVTVKKAAPTVKKETPKPAAKPATSSKVVDPFADPAPAAKKPAAAPAAKKPAVVDPF